MKEDIADTIRSAEWSLRVKKPKQTIKEELTSTLRETVMFIDKLESAKLAWPTSILFKVTFGGFRRRGEGIGQLEIRAEEFWMP
jgi:hypothetical protein